MTGKSQEQLIWEVHQGMFGVDGSDEKGLVGDMKETKEDVKKQNGRVTKIEGRIKYMYGLIIGAALAGGGIGASIGRLFDG